MLANARSGMELFAITCTTCKSRLKVRDPAAIGQILSCPKCGGMVMVKPPPAFSEATEQKSDLPTATEVESPTFRFGETPASSAFDLLDELLSDAPPRVQTPRPPTPQEPPPPPAAAKPRFVGGPPVHRSSTPPVHRSSTPAQRVVTPTPGKNNTTPAPSPPAPSPPAPAQPKSGPPSAATADPAHTPVRPSKSSTNFKAPPPSAEAQAAHSKNSSEAPAAASSRRSHWLLMTGSVVLGIGLALVGVCAVILMRPTGKSRVGIPTETKRSPTAPQKAETPSPNDASFDNIPAATTAAVPRPTIPNSPDPTAPPPEPAATTSPPAKSPASEEPPGLASAPSASAAAINASADSLAKFDRILSNGNADPLAKPSTPIPPDSASSEPADTAPPRPIAPRPPQRDIDVAKLLADSIPGIESAGTPLAEFVDLISNLTTIPITLELPLLPATAESPVVFKGSNTTVGAALKDALATLRLEYVVSNDQLIVRRQEPNPVRALVHDVRDLTSGDEQQMHDLAEFLQAVVEPGVWGDGAGQGSISIDAAKSSLTIRHRRATQFQVLLAIEKLRASRTPPLPPKTPINTTLFQLDSRLKQAGPRLVKPLSLNFSRPTRLVEICDLLSKLGGMRVVVDWHDVVTAGWNPAGEATLVANNQPLVDALESLLTPLDLTFRIIDAQTLQVVTRARLNDAGELEAYRVADLLSGEASGDALVAKIRSTLGDNTFVAGGGTGEIRYDPTGKCLFAWLPQPRQRELEVLLATMRTSTKK